MDALFNLSDETAVSSVIDPIRSRVLSPFPVLIGATSVPCLGKRLREVRKAIAKCCVFRSSEGGISGH